MLTPLTAEQVTLEIKDPVDPGALEQARAILKELGDGAAVPPASLLKVARRLGDVPPASDPASGPDPVPSSLLFVSKEECKAAFDALPPVERSALINIHARVRAFALAQRASVTDMEIPIPGGRAGHTVAPCQTAGCYAPGGRYPLPSSVVMTAVTARAAGCAKVILASPRPQPITLAAAHVCQVDVFLRVGGAQAVAAMAYGVAGASEPCDVIVGPGNKWVTAAKSLVNGYCGIDMLAGPSEVLVIADPTADAEVVAADLIAQAEHDVVARAILLSTCSDTIDQINVHVKEQVAVLPEPNRSTARRAFQQSFSVRCASIDEAIALSDSLAPEHLEIHTAKADAVGARCGNYGGLFVGRDAAEVLGDYGAGPNHTLPTGGTGRYTGGLSVFNFLRIRTWMRVDDREKAQGIVNDSIVMARCEGLEGHARAAECRSLTAIPAYKTAKPEVP